MTARVGSFLISVVCLLGTPLSAQGWTHMARAGETLDQLSVRYYGDSGKSIVIRAANGFIHPDDGRLTEGESIIIPEVSYIRVEEGDSWESLANQYLCSPRRAGFLADMNEMSADRMPPVGAIIRIPYHLRHIFAKDESLRTVVKLYYQNKRSIEWLRNYNNPQKKKYGRGEVIIVPLLDIGFSAEEQRNIDAYRMNRFTKKDLIHQKEARNAIAELKSDYEKGRYVEMVTTASKLLGYGKLTVPQEIGIYNFLAYAYVALDEKALAISAFREALARQPEMELSSITTSPKILEAFNDAKKSGASAGHTSQATDKPVADSSTKKK